MRNNTAHMPWPTEPGPTFARLLREPVPEPLENETNREYLARCGVLDDGFAHHEVVSPRLSRRRALPPRELWSNMVLTLAAANELRRWCLAVDAVEGQKIVAGYRSRGGAAKSRHKRNCALDLDRIGGDGALYFATAVRFWCRYGAELQMGLGLYTGSSRPLGGMRVHIDVGTRCRSWQGIGRTFGKPYRINGKWYGLPVYLAYHMGLDVPSLTDL